MLDSLSIFLPSAFAALHTILTSPRKNSTARLHDDIRNDHMKCCGLNVLLDLGTSEKRQLRYKLNFCHAKPQFRQSGLLCFK